MNLIAIFPKDRYKVGTLQAWHNGVLLEEFPVLGKADNAEARNRLNPRRDPLLPYGDTPTGLWKIRKGITYSDTHTYGVNPVFVLTPISGDALTAYTKQPKRSGIWLHGGALNSAGQLRPTYGCLRTKDEHMARLHALSAQYGPIETLETKEVGNV